MEALGINLPGLITSIVSFLILFGILRAVLYKPMLKMLDNRSARIKDSLETAERTKKDAERSQEETQRQIEAARNEGQSMIVQAKEIAGRVRQEELAKAREEIEAERSRAQADIQRERDSAIEELRREFSGLALSAAERIVEHSLNESAHKELIEKVLEESSSLGSH
ncbi:MAG: F0F1 ATP synthase subunit B [SAR202 cluster bacterium]|jgi:F-type H+-transporting ATPase subunit b|nr:F0F1 ATP synthase subunit B [SAR202 cluster bacterium]